MVRILLQIFGFLWLCAGEKAPSFLGHAVAGAKMTGAKMTGARVSGTGVSGAGVSGAGVSGLDSWTRINFAGAVVYFQWLASREITCRKTNFGMVDGNIRPLPVDWQSLGTSGNRGSPMYGLVPTDPRH